MKKEYITPSVTIWECGAGEIITTSNELEPMPLTIDVIE